MKKIAIAVMLLSTTAFAGVTLSVNPVELQLNPGDTGTVTISLDAMTGGLGAIGIYGSASQADAVKITSAVKRHPNLSDGPANDPATFGWLGPELGSTGSFGFVSATPAAGTLVPGELVTLTLQTNSTAVYDAANPLVVTFAGDYALVNGESDLWQPISVSIVPVPEPASMLLLAAGAAFFARRRRA